MNKKQKIKLRYKNPFHLIWAIPFYLLAVISIGTISIIWSYFLAWKSIKKLVVIREDYSLAEKEEDKLWEKYKKFIG